MLEKIITSSDAQRELNIFARNMSKSKFFEYINNMKIPALVGWFSLQSEETQQSIINLRDKVNDLIYKYVTKNDDRNIDISVFNNKQRREYLIFGLCLAIGKHIADKSVGFSYVDENTGYKEKMIKENADLIETIIFDLVAHGRKHWRWADVHEEFFHRLDKKYLRGSDKRKKDYTKIVTVSYFRRMASKYIYTKSARTNDTLLKGELNNLIKEHVDALVNNYSDATEVINADEFSSGNKG